MPSNGISGNVNLQGGSFGTLESNASMRFRSAVSSVWQVPLTAEQTVIGAIPSSNKWLVSPSWVTISTPIGR